MKKQILVLHMLFGLLNSVLNIVGSNFATVKFQKKKKVKLLGLAVTRMKVKNVLCAVEPEILFRKISFTKNLYELFKLNFVHELALYPVSLFDESRLRKTKKSMMYEVFASLSDTRIVEDTVYVIEGGFLFHRVV